MLATPKTDPSRSQPRRVGKKKTALQRSGKAFSMWVRRVHLYSGLFMFPFVLLYGVSGWLFNHPRSFSGDSVRSIELFHEEADTDGSRQDKPWTLPTASEWASRVAEELHDQSTGRGGPPVQLDGSSPARFIGFPSFTATDNNGIHRITVQPVTGTTQIRTTRSLGGKSNGGSGETANEPPNPIADIDAIELPDDPHEALRERLIRALESTGIESDRLDSGRRSTLIEFGALAGDTPVRVRYGISNGAIRSYPAEERSEMEVKSFLQRLHLARTYSPQVDTRWVWGLVVDAMVVSMIFWGGSGLIMWWQVKRTRRLGLLTIAVSVFFTLGMGTAMHDELTKPSGRRSSSTTTKKSSPSTETPSTPAEPTVKAPPNSAAKSVP